MSFKTKCRAVLAIITLIGIACLSLLLSFLSNDYEPLWHLFLLATAVMIAFSGAVVSYRNKLT